MADTNDWGFLNRKRLGFVDPNSLQLQSGAPTPLPPAGSAPQPALGALPPSLAPWKSNLQAEPGSEPPKSGAPMPAPQPAAAPVVPDAKPTELSSDLSPAMNPVGPAPKWEDTYNDIASKVGTNAMYPHQLVEAANNEHRARLENWNKQALINSPLNESLISQRNANTQKTLGMLPFLEESAKANAYQKLRNGDFKAAQEALLRPQMLLKISQFNEKQLVDKAREYLQTARAHGAEANTVATELTTALAAHKAMVNGDAQGAGGAMDLLGQHAQDFMHWVSGEPYGSRLEQSRAPVNDIFNRIGGGAGVQGAPPPEGKPLTAEDLGVGATPPPKAGNRIASYAFPAGQTGDNVQQPLDTSAGAPPPVTAKPNREQLIAEAKRRGLKGF